jgi:uncharacterized secreted protein with C-terminal beta-propeller domain
MSLWLCVGLAACGGGGESVPEEPLNVDYSTLKLAQSRDAPLEYARTDDQIFRPLRNGIRITVGTPVFTLPDVALPSATTQLQHSSTTLQVEGVDEADSVKYDGRYIYSARPEFVPASANTRQLSRNVLGVSRTDPLTAAVEPLSNYVIEGEQSAVPALYHLPNQEGTAEYLVAVSQNFEAWTMTAMPIAALVIHPDRTTIQVLDVRDPRHVSQAWKLELDGWMRASRLTDDTLYVVSSFRPRFPDLMLPADTLAKREANERRIRTTAATELLPSYSEDGGPRRRLPQPDGCLVAQQIESTDSYMDLLVITAINVRTRHVTDVNCLSTNVNAVYVSRKSLYVGGSGFRSIDSTAITVLHKFAIEDGGIAYRATGAVVGTLPWSTPSYFMDEHDGDLRILTTANGAHRLTVLRESTGRSLTIVSTLPNTARPAAIGKPGESVFAVRFMEGRAYVVTFRMTDPLYVIDLHDPADPAVAGELEIPGFSTYLRPLGPTQSEFLLAVGQNVAGNGRREGVKVELFDVRDIASPQSVGAEVFGGVNTLSPALDDPHALAFLTMPGPDARYRLALPIDVSEVSWQYSGLHLLDIDAGATPELHFHGVIKTEESGSTTYPRFSLRDRGVLHGDAAFAVHGDRIVSSLWQNVTQP